jgi:hypothetical protein
MTISPDISEKQHNSISLRMVRIYNTNSETQGQSSQASEFHWQWTWNVTGRN